MLYLVAVSCELWLQAVDRNGFMSEKLFCVRRSAAYVFSVIDETKKMAFGVRVMSTDFS